MGVFNVLNAVLRSVGVTHKDDIVYVPAVTQTDEIPSGEHKGEVYKAKHSSRLLSQLQAHLEDHLDPKTLEHIPEPQQQLRTYERTTHYVRSGGDLYSRTSPAKPTQRLTQDTDDLVLESFRAGDGSARPSPKHLHQVVRTVASRDVSGVVLRKPVTIGGKLVGHLPAEVGDVASGAIVVRGGSQHGSSGSAATRGGAGAGPASASNGGPLLESNTSESGVGGLRTQQEGRPAVSLRWEADSVLPGGLGEEAARSPLRERGEEEAASPLAGRGDAVTRFSRGEDELAGVLSRASQAPDRELVALRSMPNLAGYKSNVQSREGVHGSSGRTGAAAGPVQQVRNPDGRQVAVREVPTNVAAARRGSAGRKAHNDASASFLKSLGQRECGVQITYHDAEAHPFQREPLRLRCGGVDGPSAYAVDLRKGNRDEMGHRPKLKFHLI